MGLVQFHSVSQDIHGNQEFITAFRGAITWLVWTNKFTPHNLGSLMSLLKHPPPPNTPDVSQAIFFTDVL